MAGPRGAAGPARALTDRNLKICRANGWNDDAGRCDRLLGRFALAAGDTAAAGERLAAAVACFRDGDHLTELAITLADLAEHARAAGDPADAERHATEAITIASPRHLFPPSQPPWQPGPGSAPARPRQPPALITSPRAGTRPTPRCGSPPGHHLAWHELDALRAHTALDLAEGTDRGWAARADALHARLVPPGLDPDPLTTVERLVSAQKTAKQAGRRRRLRRK